MRILVIEDDCDLQNVLSRSLRDTCFAVDCTSSGNEGYMLALINPYDLIILDCALSDKSSLEICMHLRAKDRQMPIIVTSRFNNNARMITFLNNGADDYIGKPFLFQELLARINALLRRPPLIIPVVHTIHDLRIDCGKQIVLKGKREISLTRKEFALLEYFARNKGLVLSRGALMEHVWEKDIDLFSNTIEAPILNLRKKLGDKRKFIVTVPGRGYRLSV